MLGKKNLSVFPRQSLDHIPLFCVSLHFWQSIVSCKICMVFVPHFLAPQNPFELFKFLANSSFGDTVHFTYQTFFKRKKKCILFISRVCSCLDRLRLRQKDSNLIFAWNTFYRLFIIVLRYISSFATVDVNLTHSYWSGQAFCCNQPLCYITLSFLEYA